jgi:FMN phosphatase YigB (HAD superfamily)
MHVRQHARVGMITNGPSQIQRDKITRLAIAELFEFILVSEEEGVWKPDPVIFERALELTGMQARDAVYVGDSPEHDIAGARAAGIRSIWINRRGRDWPGGPPPDHVIASLLELPTLLGMTDARTDLKST